MLGTILSTCRVHHSKSTTTNTISSTRILLILENGIPRILVSIKQLPRLRNRFLASIFKTPIVSLVSRKIFQIVTLWKTRILKPKIYFQLLLTIRLAKRVKKWNWKSSWRILSKLKKNQTSRASLEMSLKCQS